MAEDGDKDSGHRRLRPVCPGRLRGTLEHLQQFTGFSRALTGLFISRQEIKIMGPRKR